jgi:micrococcal nuclease
MNASAIPPSRPSARRRPKPTGTLVQGQRVWLELDVPLRDGEGRLLAYVYVGDFMVNAELVRLGYAQVATVPSHVTYQELFLKLQREAQEVKRGLWVE